VCDLVQRLAEAWPRARERERERERGRRFAMSLVEPSGPVPVASLLDRRGFFRVFFGILCSVPLYDGQEVAMMCVRTK
jgi:hypothetical protein